MKHKRKNTFIHSYLYSAMLDINSSNESPLFGTMGHSSCGMEDVVIQRPLPTESYSWSDFPIVFQDDSAKTTTSSSSFNYNYNYDYGYSSTCPKPRVDDASLFSLSQRSSSSSSSTSTSTLSSSGSSSIDIESDIEIDTDIDTTTSSNTSGRKSVRFALAPQVRTYSLVLGDHPQCEDGLAIELGWEYSEEEQSTQGMEEVQQQSHYNNYSTHHHHHPSWSTASGRGRTSCPRRSYLSRKQLLLDVAGCTREELDERTRTIRSHNNNNMMM